LDIIISFFRDVLDGPLYVVIVVVNSILICAGIGYFAEKSQNAKKKKAEFNASHVSISATGAQNMGFVQATNNTNGTNVQNTAGITSTSNNSNIPVQNTVGKNQ